MGLLSTPPVGPPGPLGRGLVGHCTCGHPLNPPMETKRAFTYLLLKESVANDVINASLLAHDKIMLKTQNVDERRQDIDKNA